MFILGTYVLCHAFLPTDCSWILVFDVKVEFVRIVTSISIKILIFKNLSLIFTYFMLAWHSISKYVCEFVDFPDIFIQKSQSGSKNFCLFPLTF